MAHKKGVGSSDNGRDSHSKRLGVKLFGGELAKAGNIIIRQRGTKFHPGNNVGMGKDFTIFALTEGTVDFRRKKKNRTYVSVLPFETEIAVATPPKKAPAKAKPAVKEDKQEATPAAKKKEAAPKAKAKPAAEKKAATPKAKAKPAAEKKAAPPKAKAKPAAEKKAAPPKAKASAKKETKATEEEE